MVLLGYSVGGTGSPGFRRHDTTKPLICKHLCSAILHLKKWLNRHPLEGARYAFHDPFWATPRPTAFLGRTRAIGSMPSSGGKHGNTT
jgi:hypothetical protein